jgi:4-hydroxybenzoate polyprenyltransferase
VSGIVPPQGARDGQLLQGGSVLVRLANFVKLPHTVFALPFALIGVLIASAHHRVTAPMVAWTVLAFTAARFAAMGFNRIVDRDVDAANPRTAMRELPQGTLSLAHARMAVIVAALVFMFAAWRLNPLCLLLSPIALLWTLGYSYTKRFTRWSHLWLGLGLAIAPVGGYLAITGAWSEPWWLLCVLALAVVTWTGGFDILYALQDADFDRRHGLHSLPSAIGVERAITLSRALHATTVACLVLLVLGNPFGLETGSTDGSLASRVALILWMGVVLVGVMLVWEHRLVKPTDLSRLDAAFFTMNGIISIGFLLTVAAARFVASGLFA